MRGGGVQGSMTRRRMAVALAIITAGVTGCGSVASDDHRQPGPTTQVTGPDDLLVAHGMLMQKSASDPVELCVGGVAESYPPQCGGPRIVGDVDWDAFKPERSSGVTWTNGEVWAVGRLDRTGAGDPGGSQGTLTLDRPLSTTPPAGLSQPTPTEMDFPQLCEDPYAGGGRRGAGSPEQQNALSMRLESLEGYVGSWVSDGSSLFNVLVTGDAEAAFEELREVWPGGLCVEQRDLPTRAEVKAAQEALISLGGGRLLSTGGDVTTGQLEVGVVVLDRATLDAVLAAVEPWLEPSQVRFTAAFQPLPHPDDG